jgi:hypothetical protein
MNILPFIFSFLIIFALIFSYASDRRQSTFLYRTGANNLFQSIHRGFSKYAYTEHMRSTREKKDRPPGLKPTEQIPDDNEDEDDDEGDERPPTYFRKDKCRYEENKLNLSKFKSPDISNQSFEYKVAARLFKSLYQYAPFYQEGLEDKILSALLKRGDTPLYDLFQNDPLDATFYKILKGTSTYDIGTNKGYPALRDYFSFKDSDGKLRYPYLSKSVLEALVGGALMETIEKAEKENNKPLTKPEFKELLDAQGITGQNRIYFANNLRFGKTKKGAQTAFIDDDSKMIIR